MFDLSKTLESLNPNYHQYIDYSTPPHTDYNEYFVASIGNIVVEYNQINTMVDFYNFFPLHEIIETLLSTGINEYEEPGHWEYIMECTYDRIGHHIDNLDTHLLEIFYEQLMLSLDEELEKSYPGYKNARNYVFYRWFDPFSICMKYEKFPKKNLIIARK